METFGKRLARLRKLEGVSQAELAGKLNTSVSVISRYERDEMVPSLETARTIAHLLGSTLGRLIGEVEEISIETETVNANTPNVSEVQAPPTEAKEDETSEESFSVTSKKEVESEKPPSPKTSLSHEFAERLKLLEELEQADQSHILLTLDALLREAKIRKVFGSMPGNPFG